VTTHRAPRPSRRTARLGGLAAVVVGLLLSGLLIWTTSYAAYSATTQNTGDSWATGSVGLTDDDGGTALFTATGLRPGSTASRCLVVSSSGTLPATVRMYGTDLVATKSLASWITLTVTQGTGGGAGSCAGFVPDPASAVTSTLAAFPTSYGAATAGWSLAGTPAESRTYRISYTVDPNAPNSTQSATAAMTFVWEAQTPAS
jgi:hypothetical protein